MDKRPAWESGIAYELQFWSRWFETKGLEWPDDYAKRLDPKTPLDPVLADEISGITRRPARILDVGAGPITKIGYCLPNIELEIVACDPLAPHYAELRQKFNVTPPVETIEASAENLVSVFGLTSFDVVTCQNALDHCRDPMRAITEILSVVRPGGRVLLRHRRNEGTFEGYSGFHQWNLDEDNGDLIIWNQTERTNATKAIPIACDFQTWTTGDYIASRIVRSQPITEPVGT